MNIYEAVNMLNKYVDYFAHLGMLEDEEIKDLDNITQTIWDYVRLKESVHYDI